MDILFFQNFYSPHFWSVILIAILLTFYIRLIISLTTMSDLKTKYYEKYKRKVTKKDLDFAKNNSKENNEIDLINWLLINEVLTNDYHSHNERINFSNYGDTNTNTHHSSNYSDGGGCDGGD